jgi:hypothetical protein
VWSWGGIEEGGRGIRDSMGGRGGVGRVEHWRREGEVGGVEVESPDDKIFMRCQEFPEMTRSSPDDQRFTR